VTWQKEQGGAGIIANLGKWSNIKASFPLHSKSTNDELLRRWSKATILRAEDFDEIRSLFGEKVTAYRAIYRRTYADCLSARSPIILLSSNATRFS